MIFIEDIDITNMFVTTASNEKHRQNVKRELNYFTTKRNSAILFLKYELFWKSHIKQNKWTVTVYIGLV